MAEVPKQLTPITTTERAKELGAMGGKAKKGKQHLSTRIKKMMTDENFEQKLKDGTILKGEPLEAILKVAIAKARSGDIRYLDWLAKYGWGTKIDITSDDEAIKIATIIDLGNVTNISETESDSPDNQE